MRRNRHLKSLFAVGIVAVAAVATLPGFVTAQRPGGAFANNPGVRLWDALDQRFEGFSERLALSDEQANRAAVLVADFREANKSALGRYDRMRAQMRDRMGAARRGGGARRGAGGGNAQARQAMQEMRSLVDQLGPAFEVLHRDFSALLSEEQTETLRSLLQRQRPG